MKLKKNLKVPDNTIEILKNVFARAPQGRLAKAELLHVTELLSSIGSEPLAAALLTAWLSGSAAKDSEGDLSTYAPDAALEAAEY